MPGRHRLKGQRRRAASTPLTEHTAPLRRAHAVELVDAQTRQAHFLSDKAFAAGRLPRSRYITICGREVLPVSLTEAADGYCWSCASSTLIPPQRSGS